VSGAVLTPAALGPLRADAIGSAAGSAHRDATRTGRLLGGLRLHAMGAARGAWAGGAVGQLWDGAAWRRHALPPRGLWASAGAAAVVVTGTPTEVDGGAEGVRRYADLEAGLRLGRPAWSSAPRSARAPGGPPRARRLRSGALGERLGDGLAVRGASPPSPPAHVPGGLHQNFPGGRFASLGLRVAVAPRRTTAPVVVAPSRRARSWRRRSRRRERRPRRTLRLRAPGATRVELTGDPTGWTPVPLRPAGDGWWTVALPVAPGAWQVTVRVDGGAWRVPAGLPVVRDEFGGEAGLLVVPAAGR
jgi:hypothetical protein